MPQRMTVNSEHRGRGVPLSVVIEPDAQRPDQIAPPGGVVLGQRTKQRRGERRSLWRLQQLQNGRGSDIRELGMATVVTDADAQRLFGLTVRPSEFCQPASVDSPTVSDSEAQAAARTCSRIRAAAG